MPIMSLHDLNYEIKHHAPVIIFVTGPTGSGKSTFVSNLEHHLTCFGVHPGRAVRESRTMKKAVIESDNATSPKVTEDFVRDYVRNKIRKIFLKSPDASIAVDGMPRSVDQVQFCINLALNYKEHTVMFVYMTAPVDERIKRLNLRDTDTELSQKRLVSDAKVLPDVVTRIKKVVYGGRLGHYFEVNTGRDSK